MRRPTDVRRRRILLVSFVALALAAAVAGVVYVGSLLPLPASAPAPCGPKGTSPVLCQQLELRAPTSGWSTRTVNATLPAGFYVFTVAVRGTEDIAVEGAVQNSSVAFGCLPASIACHVLPAHNWTYTEAYGGVASILTISVAWDSMAAGLANLTAYAG